MSDPIVIRIFGNDLDTLHRQANAVRASIAGIAGVDDPFVEFQEGVPRMQVTVRLADAQRYGLNTPAGDAAVEANA